VKIISDNFVDLPTKEEQEKYFQNSFEKIRSSIVNTGVSTFASRTSPSTEPKLAKELPPLPAQTKLN
jgi:hypothetical protein